MLIFFLVWPREGISFHLLCLAAGAGACGIQVLHALGQALVVPVGGARPAGAPPAVLPAVYTKGPLFLLSSGHG